MAQSVLTNAQPVMYNGQHRSWTSQKYNKTYFVFEVTFANGDTGQANSTHQQSKYQIGKEYTYEKNQKENNGRTWITISGMKLVDQGNSNQGYRSANTSSGGKSGFSEGKQMSIIVQVAQICANTAFNMHNTDSNLLFATFLYWMLKKKEEKKDDIISVQGVAKIVAAYVEKGDHEYSFDDIIELCNSRLTQVNYPSWTSEKVLVQINKMREVIVTRSASTSQSNQEWQQDKEAPMPENPQQTAEEPPPPIVAEEPPPPIVDEEPPMEDPMKI